MRWRAGASPASRLDGPAKIGTMTTMATRSTPAERSVGWAIISWAEAAEGLPTLTVYLVVAIGAAVGGIVTGVALIWLSRRRPA